MTSSKQSASYVRNHKQLEHTFKSTDSISLKINPSITTFKPETLVEISVKKIILTSQSTNLVDLPYGTDDEDRSPEADEVYSFDTKVFLMRIEGLKQGIWMRFTLM